MKVREAIAAIEADGWYIDRQQGSHHVYRHPTKPGTVTIAGHPSKALAAKTRDSIFAQAGLPKPRPYRGRRENHDMRYLVIMEQVEGNLSAYVPDLPGCVALGDTREELLETMREAIAMHLKSLREHGEPVPAPNSDPAWVDVPEPRAIASAGA